MSKSFVTEKKKLVMRGETEKRSEQFEARAEQLRVKKTANDIARALTRQSLLDKRKKEQEVEETRQRKLAYDLECKRKVREAKALHALREKERKLEEDRIQRSQLKLIELCREIYIDLAVAAWNGSREVCARGHAEEFDKGLLRFGIEIRRPQELANALNRANDDLLASMEVLVQAVVGIDYRSTSRDLSKASVCLREAGYVGLSTPLTELVSPLQAQIAAKRRFVEPQRDLSVASKSLLEEKISKLSDEYTSVSELHSAKAVLCEEREVEFSLAVDAISEHKDKLASFAFIHPLGAAPVLRNAYSTFIPDKNFENFSELEIVNIVRSVNGLELLELDSDPHQKERVEKEKLAKSLVCLNATKSSFDRELAETSEKISSLGSELDALENLQREAEVFMMASEMFTQILEWKLENVESKHLKFMDGKYVGPTYARLAESYPDESTRICDAYRELNWLYGEAGRHFCVHLDIVLSELSKERASLVKLTFFDSDDGRKIQVGKDSSDCSIGHPLLGLLLAKRGFNVKVPIKSVLPVSMKLSW